MDDTSLVELAAGGDTEAVGVLYDRYAPNVYGLATRMLRDRHEAADVTSDVFVVASQRLGQLREPAKVKAWLLAIARNEVHRVMRQRTRTTPTDDLGELADGVAITPDDPAPDPMVAKEVVLTAATGLDDRDRMVLELNLAGVQGEDLSEALAVTVANAYQLQHRMKERLERSIGALLVAKQGRAECEDLATLLEAWDGTFSVLWRKRVARHVDKCDTCERRRKKAAAAVLAGAALALEPASYAIDPPPDLRRLVLEQASRHLGTTPSRRWPGRGWPPSGQRRRGRLLVAALLLLALIGAAIGVSRLADGSSSDTELATARPSGTETATTPPTPPRQSATTPTPETTETTLPAPPETVVPVPGPGDPGGTGGGGATSESTIIFGGGGSGGGGSSGSVIVTPPPASDTTPPTATISGPTYVSLDACPDEAPFVVEASDNVGVTRVELRWNYVEYNPGHTYTAEMVLVGGSWQYAIIAPFDAYGSDVKVRAVAFDAAGNQRTTSTLTANAFCG